MLILSNFSFVHNFSLKLSAADNIKRDLYDHSVIMPRVRYSKNNPKLKTQIGFKFFQAGFKHCVMLSA